MSENKYSILVVDDDERLRDLLQRYLFDNGFIVDIANDAKMAREKLADQVYDLMILDVMMPGEDGLSLTTSLRKDFSNNVPILLLTARGEPDDRIKGLEAGADDYLPKPFEPRELLLRINAILKRLGKIASQQQEMVKLGKWAYDAKHRQLMCEEQVVPLTDIENLLLKTLVGGSGRIFSREELVKVLGSNNTERTVDVQINRLRKKIEDDIKSPRYLQTIRSQGYVLWLN